MGFKLPRERISSFFFGFPALKRIRKSTLKFNTLDPTKIGRWNLVRMPPVPTETAIQGKTRNPNSKAYKTFQKQEGARLRKALARMTHGRNIFAYNNIRTNQVVYSLTRYLEKNNVLSQMVYHGKKTVPATLRKDMWSPFYSVHFHDPKVGLRAFQLLREFSLQRQLSPPKELITTTERWYAQKRPRDPMEAEKFDEENKKYVGKMLTKKERARVLMDQKATSVADIAAVLSIQEKELEEKKVKEQKLKDKILEEMKQNPKFEGLTDEELMEKMRIPTRGYLTRKARQRRRLAAKHEEEVSKRAEERVEKFASQLEELTGYSIGDPTGRREYAVGPEQVRILWSDIHDAHYAKSWPERVSHGRFSEWKGSQG